MKRLLATGAIAAAITLTLGVCSAFANVDVDLEIENLTTGEVGSSVSAAAGDQVIVRLVVTNNGPSQKVDVNVVAGTINCTHEVSANKKFKSGKSRTKRVRRTIPRNRTGTFVAEVTATGADGSSDSEAVSLSFGAAKVGSAPSEGGMFQRIFTRMLATALLDGITSDPSQVLSSFGQVKNLYR